MNRRNQISIFSRFFLSFLFLILFAGFSEAAVFNCNAGNVACLINSINDANDEVANPGVDTINLDGSTFTLTLENNDTFGPNGLPVFESEIVINGNGSTIERSDAVGTPGFRIFYISDPGGNLTLNNIVISGGLSVFEQPGGAIYNRAMLAINDSVISDNMTEDAEPAGFAGVSSGSAGGILNDSTGQLFINNSTISNNKTGQGGQATGNPTMGNAGSGGGGGGIVNIGIMTMTNSTVSGNSTGDGGLGRTDGGNGGCGGGIVNGGTMTISNSTVSGNSTGDGGDSLGAPFGDEGGDGGDGGGVCNTGSAAIATIINSTIANNSVGIRGAGLLFLGMNGEGSELANLNTATMTVSNTIVAENVIVSVSDNCLGTITDGGSNLSDDSSCGFTGDNILGINLGPLANNGGPTQTHALLAGSVAIDLGDNTICSNPPINGLDQRGVARDPSCDIGSFEGVSAPPPPDFNCSLGDVTCLIIAINDANNEFVNPGVDTINLDGSTFTLTTVNNDTGDNPNGLPVVESEIVINGNGSTVERSIAGVTPLFRIFQIDSPDGNLTLNNIIIKGGSSAFINDLGIDGTDGGGILNSGILTINESVITDNQTGDGGPGGGLAGSGGNGGGIYNSGQLFIDKSTISNNKTGNGGDTIGFPANSDGGSGGFGGGISSSGTMTISNSTVSGNSTGNGGDGLDLGGNGGNGGGIAGGTGLIINTTVTDNSVGIAGTGPTSNGTDGDGSGLSGSAALTVSNSIVADNDTISGANNCLGTITDGGSNLSDDTSCGFTGDNTPNINLGLLADNGGLTDTHALLVGSAAIDTGNNPTCSSPPINGVDQRDFPRGVSCDIGAFEVVSTATIEIMKVTNPIGGAGFDFVGTGFPAGCGLDSFTLDDSGAENCFVAVGNYTVQEVNLPVGWVVSAIDCLGSSSFSVNVDTLTINLAADEDVFCRFTNELPSQAVSSLMEDVEELQLSQGIENSLLTKLDNAQRSIENSKINPAINQLNAFINQLDDLNFNGIIANQDAGQLIGLTQLIINAL